MTQEELFRKYEPQLDETLIAELFAANGPVVSFAARRAAAPNGLIIQFATAGGGSFPPMLLNQLTAQTLLRILTEQGFGPRPHQV